VYVSERPSANLTFHTPADRLIDVAPRSFRHVFNAAVAWLGDVSGPDAAGPEPELHEAAPAATANTTTPHGAELHPSTPSTVECRTGPFSRPDEPRGSHEDEEEAICD
jgi:hypothetical protein